MLIGRISAIFSRECRFLKVKRGLEVFRSVSPTIFSNRRSSMTASKSKTRFMPFGRIGVFTVAIRDNADGNRGFGRHEPEIPRSLVRAIRGCTP